MKNLGVTCDNHYNSQTRGFNGSISAIEMEPRRFIATHILDEISYGGMSAIKMEPRRFTATHMLDEISY